MHGRSSILFSTILLVQQCIRNGESLDNSRIESKEVIVTSWNDMPFSGIVEENGTWVGKGYAFDIFNLLHAKLNFTYKIVPPKQNNLKNSGMLGLIYQKNVDVVVAFLPVIPNVLRYYSPSIILQKTRFTVLMKKSNSTNSGLNLIAPFDTTVWSLVLASLMIVGPVIYIFTCIRIKLWHNVVSERYSLFSCFWFVFSTLMQQATSLQATTNSTRVLFATWMIFILVLTSFYTANLTAFLTKSQIKLSLNSLEDIIEKGYRWMAYKGGLIEFFISQTNSSDRDNALRASVNRGEGFFVGNDSIKILNFVGAKQLFLADELHIRRILLQFYEGELSCKYAMKPGGIFDVKHAFGFPQNSSIKDAFNSVLLTLMETGVIQRILNTDLGADYCSTDPQSTNKPLGHADFLLTYNIILTGYGIATMMFLVEIIHAFAVGRLKFRRKQNKDWKPRKSNRGKPLVRENLLINSNDYLPPEMTLWMKSPWISNKNTGNNLSQGKKHYINGRTYYVVLDDDGNQRLIPYRTLSALLFQHSI